MKRSEAAVYLPTVGEGTSSWEPKQQIDRETHETLMNFGEVCMQIAESDPDRNSNAFHYWLKAIITAS